jgi:hypothetical protein
VRYLRIFDVRFDVLVIGNDFVTEGWTMDKIVEELKGNAIVAVFAVILLAAIAAFFLEEKTGGLAAAARQFVRSIGGH